MNLIHILLQSIRAKIVPLVTKLKLFLSPNYLLARLTEGLRTFFAKVLNVKPKDKNDYYTIGNWMVSKRLAFALVIIIGVLSLVYIILSWNALFPGRGNDNINTYGYNNVLLKFAKGTVRIKGKSGYLAYEGDVSNGSCNGAGTLMNPAGHVVYQGNFKLSMYEGEGTKYYDDGTLNYKGGFHENLYSGEGDLYRKNGSMEYRGQFALNMKEGEGTLYDMGFNPVFQGTFTQDDIKFSDLIGKHASELASAYTGDTVMYQSTDERVRFMPDISAMTVEYLDDESLDKDATVESVYVVRDYFHTADKDITSFSDLNEIFGQPVYVGTAYAVLPELLTINEISRSTDKVIINGVADITENSVFTEYTEVKDYDRDYQIYLHTYHKDGLMYNFVTEQGLDTFSFYYIVTEDMSDTQQN